MTLFDIGKSKPLRRPKKAVVDGPGKPQWSQYKLKSPVACDDCLQVSYEALMTGDLSTPPARFARQKRRHGGVNLLLCDEHARYRKEDDRRAYGDLPGEKRSYAARVMS